MDSDSLFLGEANRLIHAFFFLWCVDSFANVKRLVGQGFPGPHFPLPCLGAPWPSAVGLPVSSDICQQRAADQGITLVWWKWQSWAACPAMGSWDFSSVAAAMATRWCQHTPAPRFAVHGKCVSCDVCWKFVLGAPVLCLWGGLSPRFKGPEGWVPVKGGLKVSPQRERKALESKKSWNTSCFLIIIDYKWDPPTLPTPWIDRTCQSTSSREYTFTWLAFAICWKCFFGCNIEGIYIYIYIYYLYKHTTSRYCTLHSPWGPILHPQRPHSAGEAGAATPAWSNHRSGCGRSSAKKALDGWLDEVDGFKMVLLGVVYPLVN